MYPSLPLLWGPEEKFVIFEHVSKLTFAHKFSRLVLFNTESGLMLRKAI